MKDQLPLSVVGFCRAGVEQFSRRETLFCLLNHQLPILEHVQRLDPNQHVLGCLKRYEAEQRIGNPFGSALIPFNKVKVVERLDLVDFDRGPVFLGDLHTPHSLLREIWDKTGSGLEVMTACRLHPVGARPHRLGARR